MKLDKREVSGNKNKAIRRLGKVVGCVYGHKMNTIPVQADIADVMKAYNTYGKSAFFEVEVDNSKYSVVFKDLKLHPVTGTPINFDLFKADQKVKMTAEIPVVLIGESPAVKKGLGFILNNFETIKINSLPKNLPSAIEIDISAIEEVDSVILISDIFLPTGVELDSSVDASSPIIQLATMQKEEVVAVPGQEKGEQESAPTQE
jgi:large subunit ribosomal protein L25